MQQNAPGGALVYKPFFGARRDRMNPAGDILRKDRNGLENPLPPGLP